jgi:elongation factor 1-gamma
MSDTNLKKLQSKSPTKSFPLLRNGEFYLSGTLAIIHHISVLDECFGTNLLGKDKTEKSEVCMWLNHTVNSIWPFYHHIIGQITGLNQSNQEVFKTACDDLNSVLDNLNDTLRFKSFLVGSGLTFADLFLAFSLYPYFTMLLTDEHRKRFANVARLYLYSANVKQVQQVLGRPRLCHQAHKPTSVAFTQPAKCEKEQPKEQAAKGKDQAKPKDTKDTKKVETKKIEAKKPEAKPEAEAEAKEDDTLEEPKKKTINKLDTLPPSLFELDAFKKEFLNTKEKKEVLKNFWQKFDSEGFSLWFVHYQKSPEQGKLAFKTKNLRSNFLQKVDKFRKYTFAVHGVYGKEPDLEIEGVWMWRGKDIPEEVIVALN